MKRFLTITILFSFALFLEAQNISVNSFRLLETDLTANTSGTSEIDQNGETAALIKIVTTETGFTFDCGMLGIVKAKQTPGEIWLYIPRGAQKITIKHSQLGILRNYYFPITIEGAKTYEMVLSTGRVHTIIQQDAGGQYFIMHIEPSTAIVYIDDIETNSRNGVVSKFLAYGNHSYKIVDPLYKSETGEFVVGKEKKEITKKLQPDYGILKISTMPENGAKVFLDDEVEPLGITPFTTRPIKRGEHTLRFQLADFESKVVRHNFIGDGQTQSYEQELIPTFSEVTINVPNGCSLYVNGELKGVGDWKGRLSEGLYRLEAKKEGYITSSLNLDVIRNKDVSVKLPDLVPIYGGLDINCTPIGAKVYIDNLYVGENPCIINNIIIGEHVLKIETEDDNYSKIEQNIVIEENKITKIEENLPINETITFYDYEAKEICLKNWDVNKDGDLSIWEARKVQSLNKVFRLNKRIVNLDFLSYFTGVEKIEDEEFCACSSLSTIKLPQSIKEIGDNAFSYCKALIHVEMPSSLVRIGESVFSYCNKLYGSLEIGDMTFNYSDIRSFEKINDNSEIYKYGINTKRINCKVIKAILSGTKLLLYFSCNSNYEYVKSRISPKAYIQSSKHKEQYKIKKIQSVTTLPNGIDAEPGLNYFSITINNIPRTIDEVDYIDPNPIGWEIYGIKLSHK